MDLIFKKSVLKQLKHYKKKDPIAYKIINKKLDDIKEDPFNIRYKKVVTYPSYKRAKKGDYRICFKVVGDVIYVGRIEDRSGAYD